MATQRRRQSGDTVEIALEKGQVTTVLVGSVVAVGAVFLLGVAFGSRLAVAEERPDGETAVAEAAEAAGETPELTFHDALTSRREGSSRQAAQAAQAAQAPSEPAAAEPAVAEAPAQEAGAPARAEASSPEAVARAATGAAREAAAGAPRAETPKDDVPTFTVQVSSSRDEKDTERLADRLKAAGLDARVVSADIEGRGRWYRVRVGRYESRDEAMRKQAEIQLDQGLSGLVVAEQPR